MNFKKRKNGKNSEVVEDAAAPLARVSNESILFFLCYCVLTRRCSHTQTQSPVHYFSTLDEPMDGQQMDGSLEINTGDNVKYFFKFLCSSVLGY